MGNNNTEFATIIHAKDHTGWVYWENHGNREGFFKSIAAIEEYCAAHEVALPQIVVVCAPRKLSIDARWVIEMMVEDHHEDANEHISQAERQELQAILDGWCERTSVVSYEPTTTNVLLWEERDGKVVDLTNKQDEPKITVCAECRRASCWHGIFFCDDARTANTVDVPRSVLLAEKRENPSYLSDEHLKKVYG